MFWRGEPKQETYLQLYRQAALALKNVSTALAVGGPATNHADCWVSEFVEFCNATDTPFDFVSSHAYSSCGMDGLGSVSKVAAAIRDGRAQIDAALKTLPNLTPAQRRAPWLITEFGDNCAQGFGKPGPTGFPSAIHDMVDQASYTVAAVDALAGPGEPQALSYWAVSDVFEESFFPVHNESFHGMFGLINLHGVPKPTYRAYQLLHESGDTRVKVQRLQPLPQPTGTCAAPLEATDVWGGDVGAAVSGVDSVDQCCKLCLEAPNCDVGTWWHSERKCGLKSWAQRVNTTRNLDRTAIRTTTTPFTNDQLCALNTGVLAAKNATGGPASAGVANFSPYVLDLFVYNHAAFGEPIVACNVTVRVSAAEAAALRGATVRRIDEDHANPLKTWVGWGAPDYTNASQNAALRAASEMVAEPLLGAGGARALASGDGFSIEVPSHGVAAVRISL